MAKKAKFDFNSFVQELKDTAISKSVDLDSKIERRYYLIVCEGEKTEPIYFEYFQKNSSLLCALQRYLSWRVSKVYPDDLCC